MDKHNEKDSRRLECTVQRFIGQKQNNRLVRRQANYATGLTH
jgi:hypothetical protein